MAFDKLTTDLNNVQALGDRPNALDGLSAAELKQRFDMSGNQIKEFLNDVLIPALEATSAAANIGATTITDLDGETVQALIESVRNKLKSTTTDASGAGFVGAATIDGLAGNNVQSLLQALKTYVDNQGTTIGNNYVSKTEMTTVRKIDPNANFTGSWHGISNPAMADPGIAGVVSQHTAQLADMAINVKTYGAKGDGTTDDTAAIQAAANAAMYLKGTLIIPDGTYMIQATGSDTRGDDLGGIIIDRPVTIQLSQNATLKAITGNKNGYAIINIKHAVDVSVRGGIIIGERYSHIGTTGEHGFGIRITASKNVLVEDVHVSDCWGDGIVLRPDVNLADSYCEDIYIRNAICDNNRRQGLTIASAANVIVSNSQFNNTNGTAPQAGIDIESDTGYVTPKNISITSCKFIGNVYCDIALGNNCENINITGNTMQSERGVVVNTGISVIGLRVENNNFSTVGHAFLTTGSIESLVIIGNTITCSDSLGSGLYLDADLTGSIIAGNRINSVRDGIFLGSHQYSGMLIDGNTITDVFRFLFLFSSTVEDSQLINNVFVSASNSGVYIGFKKSVIAGNKISNVAQHGMIGSPVGCAIKNNQIIEAGTSDPANLRSIFFDSVNASDNSVVGNFIRNSNTSHIGIRSFFVPAALPNLFADNDLRYSATSLSVDAANISRNNYLLNSLQQTFTWDPGNLTNGSGETSSAVTVAGAALGDFVRVSAPYDLQGLTCSAYVSAANTVRVRLQNSTGVDVNLASGVWKVRVEK